MKTFPVLILSILFISFQMACTEKKRSSNSQPEEIKAYNLDFNWGEGGPNAFAAPGLWADAAPSEHIKWYKDYDWVIRKE